MLWQIAIKVDVEVDVTVLVNVETTNETKPFRLVFIDGSIDGYNCSLLLFSFPSFSLIGTECSALYCKMFAWKEFQKNSTVPQ